MTNSMNAGVSGQKNILIIMISQYVLMEGKMDIKSLLIGFLLAAVVFLATGFGGNNSGRYQVNHEQLWAPAVIDTQTEVVQMFDIDGCMLKTYNF